MELPASRIARLFCRDGTAQPKLRIGTEVRSLLSLWRLADVDVVMPARNAQRNSLVQLVLARLLAVRVHRPHQFVTAVCRLLVQQRRWLQRIELQRRRKPYIALVE